MKQEIAFDCETIGVNHHDKSFEVLFVGLSDGEKFIQDYPDFCFPDNFEKSLLIGHNIKFDLKALEVCNRKNGFEPTKVGDIYDTQVAVHLIREDLDSYSLENLAGLFYEYPHYKYLVDFSDPTYSKDIPVLKRYNRHDLIFTKQLKDITRPVLGFRGQMPLFSMLMEYIKVLSKIEMKGVRVDLDELTRQGAILTAKQNKILEKLRNFAPINWDSVKQVGEFLISHGIRLRSTSKGNPQVNEAVLTEIVQKNSNKMFKEIASTILEYRAITKQLGTYIEGFKDTLHDGVYYPNYSLINTVTGRLAEHFIQVMPRPTTSEFKKCIVSKFKDGKLLGVDWSQLELRLIAELLVQLYGSSKFAQDLQNGIDLHAETLERFKAKLKERTRAKNVNFGTCYGAHWYKFVMEYGLTRGEAESIINDFKVIRYPEIGKWHSDYASMAANGLPIESFYGRIRHTRNFKEAVNAPIQGAGSDWNKIMAIKCAKELETRGFSSHWCADIHDENVFDICPEEETEVVSLIKKEYSKFSEYFFGWFGKNLTMNYSIEMKIGKNLYDMEKL